MFWQIVNTCMVTRKTCYFLTFLERSNGTVSQKLRKLLKCLMQHNKSVYSTVCIHVPLHNYARKQTIATCSIVRRMKIFSYTRRNGFNNMRVGLPQSDWWPSCNKSPPGRSVRRVCRSLSDVPGSDSGSHPHSWWSIGDGQQRSLSDLYSPE